MQPQPKTATLTTIFSDVLADLAFMFTDDERADVAPGDGWLETTISYRGTVNGTLRFRCTRSFSLKLAENLLGALPGTSDVRCLADDAVKEFMNIVCGQFITAMHGTHDVFNLSIPEITELSESPDLDGGDGAETSTLSVDGWLVQLTYQPGS